MRLSLLSAGTFLWYTRLGTDETEGLAVGEEGGTSIRCGMRPDTTRRDKHNTR